MRKIFSILIFIGLSAFASGQTALSFDDAQYYLIDIPTLDHTYKSALNHDSAKAAFAGREQEFKTAYRQMLGDLGVYLSKNNFFWERETKFFNRVYFNEKGGIDYYIYSFTKDDVTSQKEMDFKRLMNQFIKNYRFSITCNCKFAEYSPVTFLQSSDNPSPGKSTGTGAVKSR
jgi:hypothetical protein